LGRQIKKSRLCAGEYRLGSETIRATVIGAGCHSAQLSGSTVYLQNVPLPLKNRPVVAVSEQELSVEGIRQKLAGQDTLSVLALPGFAEASYSRIKELAAVIAEAVPDPILVCVEQDMAKALGQAIALCRGPDAGILCIDRVRLKNGDYLDVGSPIGPALPVVVKTLILEK